MTSHEEAGPTPGTGHPLNAPAADDDTRNRDDVLAAVPGYVLLVETPRGKYKRRAFLTLSAAVSAVARARERGQYAEIVLVRIAPVAVVP